MPSVYETWVGPTLPSVDAAGPFLLPRRTSSSVLHKLFPSLVDAAAASSSSTKSTTTTMRTKTIPPLPHINLTIFRKQSSFIGLADGAREHARNDSVYKSATSSCTGTAGGKYNTNSYRVQVTPSCPLAGHRSPRSVGPNLT